MIQGPIRPSTRANQENKLNLKPQDLFYKLDLLLEFKTASLHTGKFSLEQQLTLLGIGERESNSLHFVDQALEKLSLATN